MCGAGAVPQAGGAPEFEAGAEGVITLDSGAGVSVRPKTFTKEVRMMPKKAGLKMVAANGTEIENVGQKVIKFQGRACENPLDFTWRS